MTTINLANRTTYPIVSDVPGTLVWTKAAWGDSWTQRDDLIATETTWTAGNTKAVASLYHPYGSVRFPGDAAYSTVPKITARGYFVLIARGCDDGNPLYWLGYAESPINGIETPARDGLPVSGEQTIPCIGMIGALQECWIVSTVHEDPAGSANTPKRRYGGAVFNRDGIGNRNNTKKAFGSGQTAYSFINPSDDGDFWSTRNIVEHLIAFHLPTTDQQFGAIPWGIPSAAMLPTWDRPEIETDGRSVADIVSELLSPNRLLNFGVGAAATFVDSVSPPNITAVTIQPFTHLASALTLPAFGTVPANTNTLQFAGTDPVTTINLTADESEVVDQVIVRGPREIGIGTFRQIPTELDSDWTTQLTGEYTSDPEAVTDWAAKKKWEKREINTRIRATSKFRKVFRTFKLAKTWDGKADGKNVLTPIPAEDEEDPPETYVPFLGNIEFMDRLPLYEGVNYFPEDLSTVDESMGETFMENIYMIENPDSNDLEDFRIAGNVDAGIAARTANGVNLGFSGSVDNERGPRINVEITGGPRHAVAGGLFSGNDGDDKQSLYGGYNYDTIRATLAIRGDRRPSYELPATSSLLLDVVRRKIVTIEHQSLELVHIAQNTIIDFDEFGELLTSGGVIRDPTEQIQSIATMLAGYYLTPRNRVVVNSGRVFSGAQIGSILTTATGYFSETANAPIIEITISSPIGNSGEDVQSPTTRITAATQAVDVMALLAPVDDLDEVDEVTA